MRYSEEHIKLIIDSYQKELSIVNEKMIEIYFIRCPIIKFNVGTTEIEHSVEYNKTIEHLINQIQFIQDKYQTAYPELFE